MNDNFKRLTTFDRWPDYMIVSTRALSDAGFVYTGRCDEVKCEYCHIRIRDWKDEDVPRQRHLQMSPNCAFARALQFMSVKPHKETHGTHSTRQKQQFRRSLSDTSINIFQENLTQDIAQFQIGNTHPALPGGEPNAHDRTTTSEFISDQQHQTTTSKSISDQQHRTTTYEFMSAKPHEETHGTPSTRQKQFRRSLSDTSKNIFQEKLAQDLAQIGNTHPGYQDYGSIKKAEQHDVHTLEHATQKSKVDDPRDQMSSSMLATSHGNTLSEDQTKIMRDMGYSDRAIRRGVQIVLSVPGNNLTLDEVIDAVIELEDETSDSSEDGAKGGTKLYKADSQQHFNTSDNRKLLVGKKQFEQKSTSESQHLSKDVQFKQSSTSQSTHFPQVNTHGLSESCKEVPDMVNTTPNERHHSGNTVNETKLMDKNRHPRSPKRFEHPWTSKSNRIPPEKPIGLSESCDELTSTEAMNRSECMETVSRLKNCKARLKDENKDFKQTVTRLTYDNKECNETVTRLKDENKELRSLTMCKVCLNNAVDTLLLPCRHLICCEQCGNELKQCPLCRTEIAATVKTFMS